MTPNTEVVCIDDSGDCGLVKNATYIINQTRKSFCPCDDYEVDIGNTHDKILISCPKCGAYTASVDVVRWYSPKRFVPIDSISISEAYEVLEKEPFEL